MSENDSSEMPYAYVVWLSGLMNDVAKKGAAKVLIERCDRQIQAAIKEGVLTRDVVDRICGGRHWAESVYPSDHWQLRGELLNEIIQRLSRAAKRPVPWMGPAWIAAMCGDNEEQKA